VCCVGFVRGGVTNGKKEYVVDKYQARYDAVVRARQDERRAALIAALKSDKRVSFMDRVKVALANMRKGK
jgi:hypothetical protein